MSATYIMNISMIIGTALLVSGAALLAVTIPILAIHHAFTAYTYLKTNNLEVNILVQLMALGAMIVPFGLILISKGRSTNSNIPRATSEDG